MPTALIVDNNIPQRAMLELILGERCGLDTVLVATGTKALTVLTAGPVMSLVIIDANLKDMEGYQLYARIRETNPPDRLPILITGDDLYFREEYIPLRDSLVGSPFDADWLVEQVQGLLDQGQVFD